MVQDLFESPKKMTDADKILQFLMQGNSITFLDCIDRFNTISLRERIRDLKKRGINIQTEKVKNENTGRYHAKYSISGLNAVGC